MYFHGPSLPKIVAEESVDAKNYDGIILVSAPLDQRRLARLPHEALKTALERALKTDPGLESDTAVLPLEGGAVPRLVHAPTGPVDPDYDDIRVFKAAAAAGIKRALRAKIRRPLLLLEEAVLQTTVSRKEDAQLATLLGALEALYVPIQLRESDPSKAFPVEQLGVVTSDFAKTTELVKMATILERGRRVACDIAEGDPERMSPPRVEEYITKNFEDSSVSVTVVKDLDQITKDYPLFEAVNRAASKIERHQGRIVYLEYAPKDVSKVTRTLFVVGKGVTYDTGGTDVKTDGNMVGMSRDKAGAGAAVGFMEVVRRLAPDHVRVVVGVSLVRNSIGSNGYVADEVITARSGARVRVYNTDAEGRMVMADVLCKFKEDALTAVNPHLFTIATLTGHAYITVGEGYSIVLDNGPARKAGNASLLQKSGDLIGDVFEVSTIRQDDFKMHRGEYGDDVKQSNTKPSSRTCRGHQGPAAFLILASGLDKYGSGSENPLKYSHIDIAGSDGAYPKPPTGSPVLALTQAYLLTK